ncbi:MAG: TetR/AcrR family transcriptional regulator [Anaerolineae bacterium]|jgi:AcrR family transcriptional regulator
MDEGKSPKTQRCILEAAQRLFAAHGYYGTSIRDIVQVCGVSNAALYYHFESKQNLYFEVLRQYIAAAVERLQQADPGQGSYRSRLGSVALAYARLILESQNVLQTLMRDMGQFDQADVVRKLSDWSGQVPATIGAILEEGIAAGELRPLPPRRTAMLILGMVNSIAGPRLHTLAENSLEKDMDLAMDVLFEGIAS